MTIWEFIDANGGLVVVLSLIWTAALVLIADFAFPIVIVHRNKHENDN